MVGGGPSGMVSLAGSSVAGREGVIARVGVGLGEIAVSVAGKDWTAVARWVAVTGVFVGVSAVEHPQQTMLIVMTTSLLNHRVIWVLCLFIHAYRCWYQISRDTKSVFKIKFQY